MSPTSAEESARSRRSKLRACDACRVKKARCNASEMPNGICSTCVDQRKECSYQEGTRRRTAPKWYVEKVEERMEKMEVLFKKLHPDMDFESIFGPSMPRGSWEYAEPEQFSDVPTKPTSTLGSTVVGEVIVEKDQQKEDEQSMKTIQIMLKKFKLADGRHYGLNSNARFLQAAIDSKPGQEAAHWYEWVKTMSAKRRKSFWTPGPWELRSTGKRLTIQYTFPPADLIPQLIQHYFWNANLFYPILHGPTFLAHYANDLHERDSEFAALLVFVCAVGSRWCDDPRVRERNEPHSAGWKYFEQAWPSLLPSHEPVTLTKLQCYCVALMFMMGGGMPQVMWMVVGVALHQCQDVGAHLKGTFKHRSLVDQELYRRAFWTLFAYDASFSTAMGRLSIFSCRDFDVERPMEVDDEYWLNDDPNLSWKQPPEKPSLVTFFNRALDLMIILNESRRALFPLSRQMPRQPNGPESEQDVLMGMDSALNKWLELLPDHLRWDPRAETSPLFIQNATLHLHFHQCTIVVHREFLPTPRAPVQTSSPSLAICTNAARRMSRILGVLCERELETGLAWVGMCAFHAAVILLLNIWGTGGKGSGMGYASQLQDIHNCIWTLLRLEKRWPGAGKLRDVLEQLASVGDFPLPEKPSSQPNLKRGRSGHLDQTADYASHGLPAVKALRTSTTTSPQSFIQSSPSSVSLSSSSSAAGQFGPSPEGQGRAGVPAQMPEQLGEVSSTFLVGDAPYPFQGEAGGAGWGSTYEGPSFDAPHDMFGMLGTEGDTGGMQNAGVDVPGGVGVGLATAGGLEPMALDALMQLWTHTPMGTGWELWDSLPIMPIEGDDLNGSDHLSTIVGADGGVYMHLDGREV